MEILVALVATVPVLVVVVAVVLVAVRGDGYGHRPPPSSRREWQAGDLPSRAYREG
ncbi:MAG: hypothetical protein PGN11_10670 [Quadrisphaera sp.]